MITKKALYTRSPLYQCEFDGDYFYTYIVYKPHDKCVLVMRKSHYGHRFCLLFLVYDLEYDLHNDIFNHNSMMNDLLLKPENSYLYLFFNKPFKFTY